MKRLVKNIAILITGHSCLFLTVYFKMTNFKLTLFLLIQFKFDTTNAQDNIEMLLKFTNCHYVKLLKYFFWIWFRMQLLQNFKLPSTLINDEKAYLHII